MIDSMLQEGTDASLDDQVARPRVTPAPSPSFSFTGFLGAPFRGIGAGTSKSIAFGAEISGAFGQVWGAYGNDSAGGMFSTQSEAERKQADAAREKLQRDGIDYSNEAGDIFRRRAADILPDPKTAHASEQVVAGLADYATRAVGYSIALGPLAAGGFGTDVAFEEADRLKQQGVDLQTRTKAGAAAGVLNAAAMMVPLHGPTAAVRFGKGVAAGEGAMVSQSLAEREIVRAAGYDKIADTFDPFDPVALALGIVPGAIGARYGAPKQVGKLRTEADVRKAAQLTPEEQARSDAYERSPTNLAELERAIKAEKRPDVRALLETELAKQQRAAAEHGVARAVEAEPDLAPAARVGQVVDALEASRLTPDDMLAGRTEHLSAVEMAADQMARGDRVEVAERVLPGLRDAEANLRAFMADSKVVDEAGAPRRMYHGTGNDITAFDPKRPGPHTDMGAIFLTADPQVASHYANVGGLFGEKSPNVLPVYVRARNPFDYENAAHRAAVIDRVFETGETYLQGDGQRALILDGKKTLYTKGVLDVGLAEGRNWDLIERKLVQDAIKKQGHDGFYVNEDTKNLAVYQPEQIKSAIGNSGRYDPKSASLTDPIARTAAAFDQLRAARTPPEPKAPREPAAAKEPAPKAGKATKQEPPAKAPSEPQAAKAGDGEGKAPAAIERAADDLQALDPDMLVQLEGMDAPMKVGELMAKVKEEARQDTLAGKLLEVAAACDLSS